MMVDFQNSLNRKLKYFSIFCLKTCLFRLHDRHLWSAQTSSDLKLPTESDSDSINDYAGGKVGKIFIQNLLLQCVSNGI